MPFRQLYVENEGLSLITPRAYINAESNVFDKAFNDGMDMEEWDDWMKWEGNANEVILPVQLHRKESVASTISSPETWAMGQDSTDVELISTSYTTENGFPFNDASFDFASTQNIKPSRAGPVTRASSSALFSPQQDVRRTIRGFSSLTEAEERNLQDIAMPYHALQNIKLSSSAPASPSSSISRSPSVEPEKHVRKTRKRKSVIDEELPSALCLSRKRGHNAIEKRYRTNLNDKINLLREALPRLRRNSSNESKTDDGEEEASDNEEGKASQQKCGKAATLTMALEYIKHLESAAQRLGDETGVLQTRIGAFEKLAMNGSAMRGAGIPPPTGSERKDRETLESIQAEFTQPKPKPASIPGPVKRRGSRQSKV